MVYDEQDRVTFDPPFCYFERGSLKFNSLGTNTGTCTSNDKCLCRHNDFCNKNPCTRGNGDCDDDDECEGSLVCGHLNCLNNTVTDCCTNICSNDSQCLNQECETEKNMCRLDSYSTNWSLCTVDSPCIFDEGDCDEDSDCKGSLVCGINNCGPSGPRGMDCCTDR